MLTILRLLDALSNMLMLGLCLLGWGAAGTEAPLPA